MNNLQNKNNNFASVNKTRLTDHIAQNISNYIYSNKFSTGDRLPSITVLSKIFDVGQPTMREAIKKLETYGVITVKHGSGIYISDNHSRIFVPNPTALNNIPIKKVLLDLVDARISIEVQTVSLASENIKPENIEKMENFLKEVKANIDDDEILNRMNISFHLEIANASGNIVFHQILSVLMSVYREEQKFLLHVYGSKERDHSQHVKISEALQNRDKDLAVERMKDHLNGVRRSIEEYIPEE
jgi:GntR family transcriptional regulator, transcriptional repressor for pyruvate dehydrogenase complex